MGCNFRVGMKVVFVDDSEGHDGSRAPLVKGKIYEVFSVEEGRCHDGPAIGLKLVGVPVLERYPQGYNSERFRPIVERKTSIEVFRSLLNPSKTRETV